MPSQFDSELLNLASMLNLRFIVLTFLFDIPTLNWLVNSLQKMSGQNHVEEIDIVLFPDAWGEESEVGDHLPAWVSRLDAVLLGSAFPHLKKVSIYVGWFPSEIPTHMLPLQMKSSEIFDLQPLPADLAGLWNEILVRAGILHSE
jgi:hypothetical protein